MTKFENLTPWTADQVGQVEALSELTLPEDLKTFLTEQGAGSLGEGYVVPFGDQNGVVSEFYDFAVASRKYQDEDTRIPNADDLLPIGGGAYGYLVVSLSSASKGQVRWIDENRMHDLGDDLDGKDDEYIYRLADSWDEFLTQLGAWQTA